MTSLTQAAGTGTSVQLPVAGTAAFYVDATHGSDAFNGLSIASAKATFAAAFAALPAAGGTIWHMPGTNVETVSLPIFPKVVDIFQVPGAKIQAPAINTPAIQCAGGGAVQFGTLKVTVQPHASGTTGGLVLCDGMRFMDVDATYLDNGTGGADRLFDVRAAVTTCYFNDFTARVVSASHLTRVVKSGNGGTSVTNANACTVTAKVYACANMTTVLDLGDTTGWTITPDSRIEGNTGAVAVIPGNSLNVHGYYEANAATDFVPAALGARSVDAHNVRFYGTYHAGSAMTIPTGLVGWDIDYSGTFTITDTDGWVKNRKTKDGVTTGGPGTWPGWTAAALLNSWAVVSGLTPSYRRSYDQQFVQLTGRANTGASGTVAFTLPAGYTPTTAKAYVGANASSGGTVLIVVNTNGDVNVFGGAAADAKGFDLQFPLGI